MLGGKLNYGNLKLNEYQNIFFQSYIQLNLEGGPGSVWITSVYIGKTTGLFINCVSVYTSVLRRSYLFKAFCLCRCVSLDELAVLIPAMKLRVC